MQQKARELSARGPNRRFCHRNGRSGELRVEFLIPASQGSSASFRRADHVVSIGWYEAGRVQAELVVAAEEAEDQLKEGRLTCVIRADQCRIATPHRVAKVSLEWLVRGVGA